MNLFNRNKNKLKWISVLVELPAPHQRVQIFDAYYNGIHIGFYRIYEDVIPAGEEHPVCGISWEACDNRKDDIHVTHWSYKLLDEEPPQEEIDAAFNAPRYLSKERIQKLKQKGVL